MQLFHMNFDPLSRFVRLVLNEMGLAYELIDEKPHLRREDFLNLNPAGEVPVLLIDNIFPLVTPYSIIEYLEEGVVSAQQSLYPPNAMGRAEVRRLLGWFNQKFYHEVSQPFIFEMAQKRFLPPELGGGTPDMAILRAARANIGYHLEYIGWLSSRRAWLGGEVLSYADFVAAAHISVLDYFGEVPWENVPQAKLWYARMKSRPAMRSIFQDRVVGMAAASHYGDPDF
jgi:glutathione S-transferase